MVGGLVVSILAIAVGAVLDFAVVVSPYRHGSNIKTVGQFHQSALSARSSPPRWHWSAAGEGTGA